MTETLTGDHPFGRELDMRELARRFAGCRQWEDRLRQIIMLAKALPALPEALKTPESLLTGCENRVWLGYQRLSDGTLHFFADSDGRIVKGLLAIVLAGVEGKTPQQLYLRDPLAPFDDLGLRAELSVSRASGLAAIAGRINAIVAASNAE
ncbi:cysteine desulfurase sulfur acceptor subunit CsdE [Acerihabitans arboris]|uniref:Cysteine desulfurase sulfur acceptor subunit CsdE n=1 Tax=Acerihabitans arboris TaxID=2691583 RepID=A0A845SRH4_9GAMM|nr:cysteine desulfurase sulfur acceptor subunit CsdE [Acerihabitans arboris]NDL65534.1 cysteine desulfurase sulfur acceptor subunit CsdE [Acerihabitans arboris]